MTTVVEQASQRFGQLGWPTPRLEEWKYTNLSPVTTRDWARASEVTPVDLSGVSLRDRAVAEYVYVNGIYAPELSTPNPLFVMAPSTREQHYARYADYANHAMTARNTANVQDGAFLQIDASVNGFIHVIHYSTDGYASHPRNLFVVARGAQVAIVETYAGDGTYFTNAVTELAAGEGSFVDHYKLECESIQAFHVAT